MSAKRAATASGKRETLRQALRDDPSLGAALVSGGRALYLWCDSDRADPADALKIMQQYGGHMVRRGGITRDEQVAWFRARYPDRADELIDTSPHAALLSKGEGIAADGSIDREPALISRGTAGQVARRVREGVKGTEMLRGAAAVARAVGAAVRGVPVAADPATVRARRLACFSCEHAVPNPKDPDRKIQCGECGCLLGIKTRLTSERCPIGVWGPSHGA